MLSMPGECTHLREDVVASHPHCHGAEVSWNPIYIQPKKQSFSIREDLCGTGQAGFGSAKSALQLNRHIFSAQSRVYCWPEQFY
jgi:hypothetical protein